MFFWSIHCHFSNTVVFFINDFFIFSNLFPLNRHLYSPPHHKYDLKTSLLSYQIYMAVPHESHVRYFQPHEYVMRSEEHTSELQSRGHLVCRLLLEKKKIKSI